MNYEDMPLCQALIAGEIDKVIMLWKESSESEKDETLSYVMRENQLEMFRTLIKLGASVNKRLFAPVFGSTPLMTAVSYGHIEIIEELIKKGARVNDTQCEYREYDDDRNNTALDFNNCSAARGLTWEEKKCRIKQIDKILRAAGVMNGYYITAKNQIEWEKSRRCD